MMASRSAASSPYLVDSRPTLAVVILCVAIRGKSTKVGLRFPPPLSPSLPPFLGVVTLCVAIRGKRH